MLLQLERLKRHGMQASGIPADPRRVCALHRTSRSEFLSLLESSPVSFAKYSLLVFSVAHFIEQKRKFRNQEFINASQKSQERASARLLTFIAVATAT